MKFIKKKVTNAAVIAINDVFVTEGLYIKKTIADENMKIDSFTQKCSINTLK